MIELLIGAAVGAGAMVAKDKLTGNSEGDKVKRELDQIYAENEKFRSRNKEMERQVEDLLAENQKLHKKLKDKEGNHDDMYDDLEDAQNQVKKLRKQNDELTIKLKEYKTACENYEIEVQQMKEKLG